MQATRRQFVIYSVSGVGALCLGAAAQAVGNVNESAAEASARGRATTRPRNTPPPILLVSAPNRSGCHSLRA